MKAISFLVLLFSSASLTAQSPGMKFGEEFWDHWGDGKAEIAAYDLDIPRYGEMRPGTAILIFVTEPFTVDPRVKAEGPDPKGEDVFQVLKLNLVRDFQTGIYDYNTMTSTFVGLEPFAGLPAGAPAKVTFSSQEWCGQVWTQELFHRDRIDVTSHSYFRAEADQKFSVPRPDAIGSEDQLFLWARGFALPDAREASMTMLPTLLEARLNHRPIEPRTVRLERSIREETIEVPAGSFETIVHAATSPVGTWEFWVERHAPHRIIQWKGSNGERGRLLGSDRLPYWKMNGSEYVDALERLGIRGSRFDE